MKPAKLPKRPKPPKLAKDLKKVFNALEGDVVELFLRWKIFRQLFRTNQERIDLMQAISPVVLGVFQRMLIDEVMLAIGRLTDPWGKTKKGVPFDESVVLEQLIIGLDKSQFGALVADLEKRLSKIKRKVKGIRKHRHKRLAHKDKLVLLKPKTNVLPKVKLKTVDEALDEIAAFLNAFRLLFFGSPMMFQAVHAIDDGDSLILWLKYAFEFDQMCHGPDAVTLHQRVENGLFGKA